MSSFTAEYLVNAGRRYYARIMAELENSKKGLVELDNWRGGLPAILKARHEQNPGELSIDAAELVKLMDWKLKKGKFRPMLKKLIRENKDDFVIQSTKDAYKLILETESDIDEETYVKVVREAISILNGLRGVGPATSSLILSLLGEISNKAPPFFSDESAWFVFGSDQKLKYSLPEYIQYLRIFYDKNPDFTYSFSDMEKGAWSLQLKDEFLLDETEGAEDAEKIAPESLKVTQEQKPVAAKDANIKVESQIEPPKEVYAHRKRRRTAK